MKNHTARRSSLFLMELILAILFFSLSSAVCAQLFVKSYFIEKQSIDLQHAVNAATSAAEIFRSQEDPYPLLQEQFPEGIAGENSYRFFFDQDWKLCGSSREVYQAVFTAKLSRPFSIGTIQIHKDEELIYSLDLKKYAGSEEF